MFSTTSGAPAVPRRLRQRQIAQHVARAGDRRLRRPARAGAPRRTSRGRCGWPGTARRRPGTCSGGEGSPAARPRPPAATGGRSASLPSPDSTNSRSPTACALRSMNRSSTRSGILQRHAQAGARLDRQQHRRGAAVQVAVQQQRVASRPFGQIPGEVGGDGGRADAAMHAGDGDDAPAAQQPRAGVLPRDDRAEMLRAPSRASAA